MKAPIPKGSRCRRRSSNPSPSPRTASTGSGTTPPPLPHESQSGNYGNVISSCALTTFDYDEYDYAALKAGASGFILKDSPREQLMTAIRVVAAGDALLHPSITKRLIEDFASRPTPSSGTPPELAQLTARELDVMRHVARGRSNREIATDLYMGQGTVKTHVAHILAKLGLRDRAQIVVAAYETGLIQPGRE